MRLSLACVVAGLALFGLAKPKDPSNMDLPVPVLPTPHIIPNDGIIKRRSLSAIPLLRRRDDILNARADDNNHNKEHDKIEKITSIIVGCTPAFVSLGSVRTKCEYWHRMPHLITGEEQPGNRFYLYEVTLHPHSRMWSPNQVDFVADLLVATMDVHCGTDDKSLVYEAYEQVDENQSGYGVKIPLALHNEDLDRSCIEDAIRHFNCGDQGKQTEWIPDGATGCVDMGE